MHSGTVEEPSIEGLEEVRASEIYPKKELLADESTCVIPYSLLPGEWAHYHGVTTDGIIVLSNYRLYLSVNPLINIPLGLIDAIECRDIFYIYIHCKDGRSFRCSFSNSEKCQEWFKRIQKAIMPSCKLDNHFSFVFYLWSRDEHREDLFVQLQRSVKHEDIPEVHREAERMGFNLRNVWKISKVNADYRFCPSYPNHIIVPASVSDKDLETVAGFRYSRRIPAVVWRHQQNGCVIARCSQPEVGWFGWRATEDESLFQAIADACDSDQGFDQTCAAQETYSMRSDIDAEVSMVPRVLNNERVKRKLLIIDARSYAAAVANRAKGGGVECTDYYPNCEVQFLGLANIHSIRKSFISVRALCISTSEQQTWLSSLEGTKWLQHIAGLINAGLLVVNAVDVDKRPVVVHCSDGWDRTPQIVALAELMMDPYYRSRDGFRVLVDREWLAFGHKFADRCGHSTGTTDLNERSPVFLQWLDCVHQLLHQFPCYFEFNQQFLVKLAHHAYSCLFGTFLCNTDKERKANRTEERTFSVWSFLNNSTHFNNYLFNNSTEVLRPSCHVKDLRFWSEVYMPTRSVTMGRSTLLATETALSEARTEDDGLPLVKTKSCDNIASVDHPAGRQRRSSDPNIVQNATSSEDSQLPSKLKENGVSGSESLLPASKTSDFDSNGNMNVINCLENDCSVVRTGYKIKDSVMCSNLAYREPTIDGSTDTLVSENGTIPLASSALQVGASSQQYKEAADRNLVCSVSTSTTDLPGTVGGYEILPNNEPRWSPWCRAVLEAYFSSKKTNSHSSSSHSYATPHHSRTPSSGFPATPCDDTADSTSERALMPYQIFGVDGSVIITDEIQEQLQKLICYYKRKVRNLESELWAAHNFCLRCRARDRNCLDDDDTASSADSACSGEQQVESSPGSDVSWEHIDAPSPTLWVPDHAVSHCTGCEAKFWTVKRRHHCRKCGQVFCSSCSSQMIPVPTEQLFHPVRVCNYCFAELQPQCRDFVSSCDELPKTVIAAASN